MPTALIVVVVAVVVVPIVLAILFKTLWKVPAADQALIVTGFGVKGRAVGDRIFKIITGGGAFVDYTIDTEEGMVVLDAMREIQRTQAFDLAIRWNCKAAKCGSCSAEVNGKPCLMCKTRLDELPEDAPIRVEPMRAFPLIRDLVCDVSWNYEVNKKIPPFTRSLAAHSGLASASTLSWLNIWTRAMV